MDWGSKVTYIAQTAFKTDVVPFGIKDGDRLEHVSVIGKSKTGRAEILMKMALQDIERGMSVVVLDASGGLAPLLAERLGEDARDRLVFVDPSDGEHPYSWNPIDEFRALGSKSVSALSEAIASLYRISPSELTHFASKFILEHQDTSVLLLYDLVSDPKKREKILGVDTPERKRFDSLATSESDSVALVIEHGRYIAKDTLVRNLVGQRTSKFSLAQGEQGALVIVDLSRIRMFPTRITPIVRLFTHASRARGTLGEDIALYLHDSVKYLAPEDIDTVLPERSVACVMATTAENEDDMPIREQSLKRSGTVIAFTSHSFDYSLLEQVFYPYISPDELSTLKHGEIAVILTIDSVRARPFFGNTLPKPERSGVSYQDLQVYSLGKYTTSRLEVDKLFKEKPEEKDKEADKGSDGFSGAFRSIFAKRASGATPADAKADDKKTPTTPASAGKKTSEKKEEPTQAKKELSEEELKAMLYVEQLAA